MKRLILAVIALAFSVPVSSQEAKKPSGVVNVRAIAKQPDKDGKQVIELTMTISAGWRAYANPPGNEKYDPVKTRVLFTGDNKPKVVGIDYPTGKPMTEDGAKFQGYEGQVPIRVIVERGNAKPVEVEVRFMACNDTNCIPSSIKVSVP